MKREEKRAGREGERMKRREVGHSVWPTSVCFCECEGERHWPHPPFVPACHREVILFRCFFCCFSVDPQLVSFVTLPHTFIGRHTPRMTMLWKLTLFISLSHRVVRCSILLTKDLGCRASCSLIQPLTLCRDYHCFFMFMEQLRLCIYIILIAVITTPHITHKFKF